MLLCLETKPAKNGELQIRGQENMVLAYQFKGSRFDCGSMDGFVSATNHFYQLQDD